MMHVFQVHRTKLKKFARLSMVAQPLNDLLSNRSLTGAYMYIYVVHMQCNIYFISISCIYTILNNICCRAILGFSTLDLIAARALTDKLLQ